MTVNRARWWYRYFLDRLRQLDKRHEKLWRFLEEQRDRCLAEWHEAVKKEKGRVAKKSPKPPHKK